MKNAYINYDMKKVWPILILFILISLFILEPMLREKQIFTFTFFAQPAISLSPSVQYIPYQSDFSNFILSIGGILTIIVRLIRRSFEKFKRYSDLILSIFGLTITLPILALAAILIKLNSKGPVLYKQDRVGKGGKVFEIYKLRTMRIDAENGTGAVWAKKNDPRITLVGRLLRKAHIDEIPQLFNVIKGEMSIIGPRPERPEMVRDLKTLILDYEKRLQVTPGITGFAQVWHKYDETLKDVKKKIKYDLLYVKKMCLWVDIRIMVQTFVAVFTGKGAN